MLHQLYFLEVLIQYFNIMNLEWNESWTELTDLGTAGLQWHRIGCKTSWYDLSGGNNPDADKQYCRIQKNGQLH